MIDFEADDAEAPITDEDFAELLAEDDAEPCYNLVEDADKECLDGECEHFCGEPTQDDLDRLESRGLGHLVEAYENNLHYV